MKSFDFYFSDSPGARSQWHATRDEEREPSLPQTVLVRPPNILIGFRRYCLACGVALDERGQSCGSCAAWKGL